MTIHVIRTGETIVSIAERYQVSIQRLIEDNHITDPEHLLIGQTIMIAYPEKTHIVTEGDTLTSIAADNLTDVTTLLQYNPSIQKKGYIEPGQELVIAFEDDKFGSITTNGYAYTYVDKDILSKIMPYLTYLSIFSYGFTPEGELIPIEDNDLIKLCEEFHVAPIMVLSTLTENGSFSNALAHTVLTDMDVQNRLINNIILNLGIKDYAGVDVDFEYLLPEDRDAYTTFIANLASRLNPLGYEVSVALAPKRAETQRGILYEAHDYGGMGTVANRILLMTYEWGYTYDHTSERL